MFTISDQTIKGLTVDCHFVMVPVWPLNVNNAEVPPEQIVVPPETAPAIGAASIVTVVVDELSEAQVPFFTTALN